MNLVEKLFELWKTEDLEHSLLVLQKEIEKSTGPLEETEHIEKLFIDHENNGNIWDIVIFRQFLELHKILKSVHVTEHPLMDFLDEFVIWYQSYSLDTLEIRLSEEHAQLLEDWINKINKVKNREYLFLLVKKYDRWSVEKICNMHDYENGSVSYADMNVRKMIMDHISEKIRLILLTKGPKGSYCIEL